MKLFSKLNLKRSSLRNPVGLSLLAFVLFLGACGNNNPETNSLNPSNSLNTSQVPGNGASAPPVKMAEGFSAPDFKVKDINGQTLQLSSFKGNAVLINFWAVT